VPPFFVDGLYTWPTAALNAATEADPPELLDVGVLLPQAVKPRAITVPTAIAATAVLLLIC